MGKKMGKFLKTTIWAIFVMTCMGTSHAYSLEIEKPTLEQIDFQLMKGEEYLLDHDFKEACLYFYRARWMYSNCEEKDDFMKFEIDVALLFSEFVALQTPYVFRSDFQEQLRLIYNKSE